MRRDEGPLLSDRVREGSVNSLRRMGSAFDNQRRTNFRVLESNVKTELLQNLTPFFQCLESLEALWPSRVIYLGALVRFLQPLGFVVNRHWVWGWFMGKVSDAIYVFLCPFWDDRFAYEWGLIGCIVTFWVVVVIVMAIVANMAFQMREGFEYVNKKGWLVTCRMFLHGMTSVFLMPALSLLLPMMVCDHRTKTLWVHPDVDCWGTMHSVHLGVGILTIVFLVVLSIMVRTMLYKYAPFSSHIWARPHSRLDALTVAHDMAVPLLYFTLLGNGFQQLFAVVLCIASLAMAVVFSFVKPYYNSGSTVLVVWSHLLTAVIAAYVTEPWSEWAGRDVDTIFVIMAVLLTWGLALLAVKRWRVTRSYTLAVHALRERNMSPALKARMKSEIPYRLPWLDLVFSPFRDIVLSDKSGSEEKEKAQDELDEAVAAYCGEYMVNVSHINAIYTESDIELSTRFLRDYSLEFGRVPDAAQMGYYSRLYTKGLVKFSGSHMVELHLVFFLQFYCIDSMRALQYLQPLYNQNVSMPLMYTMFRMTSRLKAVLNIKDNTHHKGLLKAHKLHVQALSYFTLFWTKLLSKTFDSLDLALLADTITEVREEGLRAYETAISTRVDKLVANRYAYFLEQVMLEEAGAAAVRASIRESQESGANSRSSHSDTRAQELSRKLAVGKQQVQSKKISGLHLKMNLMFLGFFLIVVSFAALYIHIGSVKTEFLDVVHSAGELRTLALYNSYLTLRVTNAAARERDVNLACKAVVCSATGLVTADSEACSVGQVFATTTELRNELRENHAAFRDRFQELTHGKYKMTYEPLIELYKRPLTRMTTYFTAEKSETKLAGLFVICTKILTSLEAILDSEIPCLASGAAQSFMRENTEDFAAVFNTSLELYEDEFEETIQLSLIITGVFVGVACLLVFLVYFILELSFLTIATEKMETLNLFSLIPHNTLVRIHADSKEKLAKYETLENEEKSMDEKDDKLDDVEDVDLLGETDDEKDKQAVTGAFKVFLKDTSKADGKVVQSMANRDEREGEGVEEEMQELQPLQYLDTEDDEEIMNHYPPAASRDYKPLFNALLLISLAVSLPLTIIVARDMNNMMSTAAVNKMGSGYETELAGRMWDSTNAAAAYIATCNPTYEAQYRVGLVSRAPSDTLTRLRELDPDNPFRYFDADTTFASMHAAEELGLQEVKSACGPANKRESQHDTLRDPSAYHAKGGDVDAAVLARDALGKVFTGDYYRALEEIGEGLAPKTGRFETIDDERVSRYMIVIIVLYVCMAIALSIIDPVSDSDDGEPEKKKSAIHVVAPFRVSAFLALTAFVLALLLREGADEYSALLHRRDRAMQHVFDAREALERPRMTLVEYLLLGGRNFLRRYEVLQDETGSIDQRAPHDELLRLAFNEFSDLDTSVVARRHREIVTERQIDFEHQTMLVQRLEYVALTLAASALGHDVPEIFADIHGAWSTDDAPTEEQLGRYHPHYFDILDKVNGSVDLAMSYGMQILYSNEYVKAQRARTADLDVMQRVAVQNLDERIDNAESKVNVMLPAMLVFFGLTVGIVLLNVVLVLVRHRIMQTKLLKGVAKKNQRDPEVLFRKHTGQIRISLLLFLALIVVVLIVEIVYNDRVTEIAPMLNYASARPWLRSRDIFAAQLYKSEPVENDWELSATGQGLVNSITESREGDDRLNFRYTPGASGAITDPIFGPSGPTDNRMTCTDGTSLDFGAMGIDIESRIFFAKLLQYRYDRTPERETALAEVVPLLLQGLRDSTSAFQSEAKDQLTLQTFTILGILLFASLLLAFECLFIFRPMSTKLFQQEEGTKLMVKMIPERERNTVGAIAQFLETGQVSSLKKLAVVNKVVTETSTVPTVVCDNRGTIMMFSRAAEDVFGWSEKDVLNKNVKLLMPPDYAGMHDLYLARFRKTGMKRIIGSSRNVRAQKKDGTVFPANIAVRDFRQCKKNVYIGFITDTSLDIEKERVNQLNVVISKSGFSPIICCDTSGKIIRWNRASTLTFGYSPKEAIGKNVSLLMSPDLAAVHDNYLERFRRNGHVGQYVGTGKKLVQAGVRKDGFAFNIELFLEKLKLGSDKVILVANLRDVTQDMILEQRSLVHEHLTRHSPCPLLVISTTGVIQQWNPGAERELGYTAKEAIGQNVTIIQPPEVAVKHDEYLARYLQTGVKVVLGSTREVQAKKKDGTTLHVALDIREIAPKNQQFSRLYIGFITNLAESNRQEDVRNVYETVINFNPLPTVIINQEGIILSFSNVAQEATKYSNEDAIGANVTLLMDASIAQHHGGYLERYLQTGQSTVINDANLRVQVKRKDNTFYSASLCIREVRTTRERRFIGYLHDESAKDARKLQSVVGDFVVELCPAPLICINATGQIKLFSPVACQKFGWEKDVIQYKNVKSLMAEDIAAQHDNNLLNYKTNGNRHLTNKSRKIQVQAMRSDETFFPAALTITEFLHDDASFFVGYFDDLTDQLALRTLQNASRAVMVGSHNSVITINHVGTIELTSPSALKLFGYTQEEVIGENVNILMPEKIAAAHSGYLRKYTKTGIKNVIGRTMRAQAKRKDGSEFLCDISIREIVVKSVLGRSSVVFVGYLFDTSAEYLAEQQATLNAITHDLVVYPLISISITGRIISVNQQAEEMLHVKEMDVVGKNIKIFMPDAIAEQHDGFLQKYRKTRVKHVIDSSRNVEAKRLSDGSVFPIELFVREVVNKEGQTVYYGNAKDMTKQLEIAAQRCIIENIVQLADYPIINICSRGTVKIYNKAARRMFGYREEEVVGKNIKMLQPEEVAREHDSYLERYLRTGVSSLVGSSRNVVAQHKDGQTKEIRLRVDEIRNGVDVSYVGYAKDLTEETDMIRRELISEQLQDCFLNPTFRIDTIGTILAVSKTACKTFGYEREELVGKNIKMIQPEEVAAQHDEYLRKYLVTGVKSVIDTTRAVTGIVRNPDGSFKELSVEVSVKEVKFGEGKRQYIGYLRSLEAETQANRTVKMLKQILNLTPEPLIEMSQSGIITVWNKAATNVFEWTEEEAIGMNIKTLQTPEVAEKHDYYLQRYKDTGEQKVIGTFQLLEGVSKSGKRLKVFLRVEEVQVGTMEKIFIGLARDASSELEIQRADRVSQVIVGALPQPCVIITTAGIIDQVSNSFKETYEFPDPVGSNIKLIMPPEIAEKHDDHLKKYLETGKKTVLDSMMKLTSISRSGNIVPVESNIREIDVSSIKRYVGYLRDMRPMIKAVADRELMVRLEELSPVAIMCIDGEGTILKANKRAEAMTGRPVASMLDTNIKEIMPEPYRSGHDQYLKNYRDTGVAKIIGHGARAAAVKHVDGSVMAIDIVVFRVELKARSPVYVGSMLETTQMKQLQYAEQLNQGLQSLCNEALIVITDKGNVIRFNERAEELFGYTVAEVDGKNIKMLMPTAVAEKHDGYLAQYVKTGVKHILDTERKIEGMSKTGQLLKLLIRAEEISLGKAGSVYVGFVDRQ